MIQRLQTIYLLLGALALGATLFFDSIWQSAATETFPWFSPALLVLGGLASAIAIGAIFMYKKREVQLKVVVGVQVLTVLFMLVLYGGLYLVGTFSEELPADLLVGVILPILAYVVFYMARRGIAKDIELVRSMDRLRG